MSVFENLDVDNLFKTRDLSEIIDVQKRIQYEIDKKKLDLRTMVGEKYRDVITASDTIKSMQTTAISFVDDIDQIVRLSENVNQWTAFYDRIEAEEMKKHTELTTAKCTSMQVKILIHVYERIWTALDEHDYLLAAQLYLFAQQIYTTLEVSEATLAKFPIAKQQWLKIHDFKTEIARCVLHELKRNDLSLTEACDHLAAYLLVENVSLTQLFNTFFELRKESLRTVLCMSFAHDGPRSQIGKAVGAVTSTIQLLYSCFIDNKNQGCGEVQSRIECFMRKETTPVLQQMELLDDPLMRYLPEYILEYRPVILTKAEDIDFNAINKCVTDWLAWAQTLLDVELRKLLNHVMTLRTLRQIKEEALKTTVPGSWSLLCQKLSFPPNFDVWSTLFQPLVTVRVQELIETNWDGIFDDVSTYIADELLRTASGKTPEPEIDLRWFVWKDDKNDVPSVELNMRADCGVLRNGIFMKSKGFSPKIVKIVEYVDELLRKLLDDIANYTQPMDVVPAKFMKLDQKLLDLHSDEAQVAEHMQKISRNRVEKLIIYLKRQSELIQITTIERISYQLMIARLLHALQISENLSKCFKNRKSTPKHAWSEMCAYLQRERDSMWEKWLAVTAEQLSAYVGDNFAIDLSVESMLKYLPVWTSVEKTEIIDEKPVTMNIRVPAHPNLHLSNVLYKVTLKMNKFVPYTVPHFVHVRLIETVIHRVLDTYEKLLDDHVSETQALQFLFDVRFVTLMFVERDNRALHDQSKRVCDRLKARVDPFDYDTFNPYVLANVHVEAKGLMNLFGVLVPNFDELQTRVQTKDVKSLSIADVSEADTILIALSDTQTAPLFALLPVTDPTRSVQVAQSSQATPAVVKKVKKSDKARSTSLLSGWFE